MADRRRRPGAPSPYGTPLTTASMVALGAIALGLLVFAPGASWVRFARAYTDDLLNPAQTVVAKPFDTLREIGTYAVDHMRVYEENRRLRAENRRLREWYQLAQAMRDKMDRYEEILSLNPDPGADYVMARVVAETDGPFVKTRVLNAGSKEGVAQDQAVLSEHGLVGRVVSVGARSARVLLLKDWNSRIPVMIERNDARAILAGDNSERPQLRYLKPGHGLVNGDRVITSGDGGLLPYGLAVGEALVDQQGQWRVRLYADDGAIDFVRVVKFNFPRTVEPVPAAPPAVSAAAVATVEHSEGTPPPAGHSAPPADQHTALPALPAPAAGGGVTAASPPPVAPVKPAPAKPAPALAARAPAGSSVLTPGAAPAASPQTARPAPARTAPLKPAPAKPGPSTGGATAPPGTIGAINTGAHNPVVARAAGAG
jgi:rod shape-determining protein MreC